LHKCNSLWKVDVYAHEARQVR